MKWLGLSAKGVLGMNARNAHYISRLNPRSHYPLVDDKLRTKRLAETAGIAVPPLYGVIRENHELSGLPVAARGLCGLRGEARPRQRRQRDPRGRRASGERLVKSSGQEITFEDLEFTSPTSSPGCTASEDTRTRR
jgi:hypothetical protein